jgi:hypothetical protein
MAWSVKPSRSSSSYFPGVAYVPTGVDRDLPDHDELGSVVTDRLENSHRDPSRLPLR